MFDSVLSKQSMDTPIPSTPVRNKVNFHSIADLARSSTADTRSPSPVSEDDVSFNSSSISSESSGSGSSRGDSLLCSPERASESRVRPSRAESESPPTSADDSNKGKKGRTIYKAHQVYILEQVFRRSQYPEAEIIEKLAKDLRISNNKIKIWFQNKRARYRRRFVEANRVYNTAMLGMSIPSSAGHPVHPPHCMMGSQVTPSLPTDALTATNLLPGISQTVPLTNLFSTSPTIAASSSLGTQSSPVFLQHMTSNSSSPVTNLNVLYSGPQHQVCTYR